MATASSATAGRASAGLGLPARLALIVGVLFAEKFLLNFLVDFEAAQAATGLGALLRTTQHWVFRFALSFAVALALFTYLRPAPARRLPESAQSPTRACAGLRWPALLLHCLLVLPLAPLSYYLYRNDIDLPPFVARAVLLLLFAAAAVVALFAAMAPWRRWGRAARGLGLLWLYAAAAAAAAVATMQASQALWGPTARVTFSLVVGLLEPFVPGLQSDPATRVLSTPRFSIEVSEICSGLEGIGLMLGFCAAWLIYFRRELRWPRALLLVVAGLVLIFSLNVLRIAILMLIGDGGYPELAVYGFHSVAGWIAFNCAAAVIAVISRRSAWFSRNTPVRTRATDSNPTADYLLPLLIVLAAGMASRALSGSFETFYGVKVAAAGIALWYVLPRLRGLDWRCSWRGALAGAAVAALWLAAAHFLVTPAAMPRALQSLSEPARLLWIALRVGGGVLLIPLVEELAYRGYLLRRIESPHFDSLPFAAVRVPALLLSAVAFGAAHGPLWLPGIVAGLVYGELPRRTGRFGEAVLAHATGNALLAGAVLFAGQWQLW